jgi:hypothetical protein
MIITIKQLLDEKDISIDISDDFDESLYIAYESGYELTDKGLEHFKDILDLQVKISIKNATGTIILEPTYEKWDENDSEHTNKHGEPVNALHYKCYELFEGLAGYIDSDKYDLWFKERKELDENNIN